MKKLLTVLVLSVLAVHSLRAQGRINFNNTSASALKISNYAVTQVLGTASTATFGIGPASVRIQLFAGSSSAALSPVPIGTSGTLPYVTNTSSMLNAAQGTFSGGSNLQLAGYDGTQPVFLQFTATSINGAYYAASPIIQVIPAASPAVATTVFSATPDASHWGSLVLFTPDALPVILVPPQSQTVIPGTNVSLSVTAGGPGTLSYQWCKNGSPLAGETNATLNFPAVAYSDAGNYSVLVSSSASSFTVTSSTAVLHVLPANAPSVTVNGQMAIGTVSVGSPATIEMAGGFPGGFIFYSRDGSAPTTGSTLYSGSFQLTTTATVRAMSLSGDFSQTAEAPALQVVIVPTYSLTTSVSGSGVINLNPSPGSYLSNSVVSLTAVPSAHWAFAHWTGDLSGSVNPAGLTMTGPRTVQAVFTPTAYPLTISSPGGGTVTANGQAISANTYYPTGSVVALAATPASGWSFLQWQGTASSLANPFDLALTQTQNVQAIFGTVVSSNLAGSGSITLSPANPVPYGSLVTATAVPAPGYYFVAWSGVASGTNSPTSFPVTTATPTVGALFAASPAPAIVSPPADLAVVLGQPAAFSVTASGAAPLTYQWRHFGTNLMGATSSNYPIASTVAPDAGPYDVVVLNGFGSATTSTVATLTILFPPTIAQPPQSQVVVIGSNATLSVTAAGTPPLSYQWRKNGVNLGGASATNYSLPGVTTNAAAGYDVVVTNPFGVITSAVAQLTVVFPPSVLAPPTPQTVASGSSASFTVSAAGTEPLTYQWSDPLGAIPDATNATFTLSPALTNHAGDYFAVVSNPYGQATSAVAALTVFIPVTLNSGPFSQVVAAHETAAFAVAAFGYPAPNYQWRFNGIAVPGATSSSLVLTNVGTNALGNYWAEVWNDYSATTSSAAALLMSPSLRAPFAGLTAIWGKEATLGVSAWGSGDLSYQWFKDGQPVAGATNETLAFPQVQIGDGGLYSVVVSSPYGSVTNVPAQLVINPANISLGFYAGIQIEGVPGYTYGIEFSTNLADVHAWNAITNVTLTQPVQLWLDTSVESLAPGNNGRYYRVTAP